jgi:cellobiose phosphorylase
MDKVGHLGKGESVWLAFFLHQVLTRFADIALTQNDTVFANECRNQAQQLSINIDKNAWDGDWYRRAYFDDGSSLGSAQNVECQIDSISQSWAILSGASDPERAKHAMQSVDKRLVRRDDKIIQLLNPAFNHAGPNPGYISGYVPGVRENGGQYTHAAIWTAMAFAKMGDAKRAWEAFQIINPINHGNSATAIACYKVESYVVAADVYAVAPHIGRGGWTWYTGSAGWMYTFIMESLLGLKRQADTLTINPCLPADWTTYTMQYQYFNSSYRITVNFDETPGAKSVLLVDGVAVDNLVIKLIDDQQTHQVELHCARNA